MYHFNLYTANNVIQNLNYDKQYLQSQLNSVYEKNSNLEYDNNKLKIQLEKSREIYKQLGNSYDSLNISYNNLSDDYNILLNSPSNKRSLETNNENNTLNNKTYNNDQLVISILNLFKKHKVNFNSDFSILVNSGPGSFSSMRVSLAVVKGIKLSKKIDFFAFKNRDLSQFKPDNIELLIKRNLLQKLLSYFKLITFRK